MEYNNLHGPTNGHRCHQWHRTPTGIHLTELRTPMWGEGPAGYEWQLTFNATLERLGWQPSECCEQGSGHGGGGAGEDLLGAAWG